MEKCGRKPRNKEAALKRLSIAFTNEEMLFLQRIAMENGGKRTGVATFWRNVIVNKANSLNHPHPTQE